MDALVVLYILYSVHVAQLFYTDSELMSNNTTVNNTH